MEFRREQSMSILEELSALLQQGRAPKVKQLVAKALEEGIAPKDILEQGLLAGMGVIGDKFKLNQVFVPEVLIAARAMNAGLEVLKPALQTGDVEDKGTVVIGTVKGDQHDIGKNLVKMMMEGRGLKVIDLGVNVPAEKYLEAARDSGAQIWQMTAQGDPITAAMVLFCAVVAPVLLVVSISYLWLGNVLGMNLRPVLLMLGKLKEWVMLDIYLVGIGVASIKVQDYAFLQPGIGLVAFISLTLLSILTLIHMNVEELWERFYPERPATRADNNLQVCTGCHYTGYRDARGRCRRCHTPLHHRRPQSLQRSWEALIASLVFLFPANLLPISIIYVNGARQDDTILSGIISLASSNIAIAGVVFIASILVPFTKVIVLFTLLLSIQFKCEQGLRTRILLLRLITWIGRWSMLDLFVISLTMSLINRDQLLAFTMGPAAVYFGGAVILTILAVEWLDSRLLWDAHESGNARFAD